MLEGENDVTGQRQDPARYVVISSDGHASARVNEYREYLETKYHAEFDQEVEAGEAMREAWRAGASTEVGKRLNWPEETIKAFESSPTLQPGGHPGLRDPHHRLRDMDSDGIAGEVLFPDFSLETHPPFGALGGGRKAAGLGVKSNEFYGLDLQYVGARAYNRWLAGFCAPSPERWAGIAVVPLGDVGRAVEELRWAAGAGLRGGMLLPPMIPELPAFNDPCYQPVWAACEDLQMPLNQHVGGWMPDYGTRPEAFALQRTEANWFSRRSLWFLMWGGVLERHPDLRLCFTEQDADWVPYTLRELEDMYDTPFAGPGLQATLSLRPREYWARQCYVGATFMSRGECEMRQEIGVRNLMWGGDYPHMETTFPYSRESLRKSYAGLPRDEIKLMIGENAVRVYNFDPEKLMPVAGRIGPSAEDIDGPLTERPSYVHVGSLGFR